MLTIVSTVGASLYYNYQKGDFIFYKNDLYKKLFDGNWKKIYGIERLSDKNKAILNERFVRRLRGNKSKAELEKLTELLYGVKRTTNDDGSPAWQKEEMPDLPNDFACAETQTIRKIVKEQGVTSVKLVFLASATYISKGIAKILEERFTVDEENNNKGKIMLKNKTVNVEAVETIVVPDLQILDSDRFEQSGFDELLKSLQTIRAQKKEQKEKGRIILNISGGYKVLVAPLTIFAQLLDFELAYLYENGNNLISVKKLPLSFDAGMVEVYRQFLDEKLASEYEEKDAAVLKEMKGRFNLIKLKNNKYSPTSFGVLLRNYIDAELATGKSSLGFIAEYKLYVHMLKNPTKNGIINIAAGKLCYSKELDFKILKSVNGQILRTREYDLIYHKDNANVILFEVKSLFRANKYFNKVKKGILKRLEEFFNKEYKTELQEPQAFYLVLWKFKNGDELTGKSLEKLNTLKGEIKDKHSLDFMVYGFDLDTSDTGTRQNENPIKNALGRGISIRTIIK